MLKRGIIVALLSLLCDQLHKWYMLDVLQISEPITIFPFFNFVMVWNSGISFGMFQNTEYSREIFTVIAIAIIAVLFLWLRKVEHIFTATGIGFIIGGAVGNIIDRVRFGAVADFFDFHILGYHWPAFNIADALIFTGAVILCIDSFFCHDTKRKTEK